MKLGRFGQALMYLLMSTCCRSRRRWRCGKCEAGRSECPTTNIYLTQRVWGTWTQVSRKLIWNHVSQLVSQLLHVGVWLIDFWFLGDKCIVIECKINPEIWVKAESQNTTTERPATGLENCMNLSPMTTTGKEHDATFRSFRFLHVFRKSDNCLSYFLFYL